MRHAQFAAHAASALASALTSVLILLVPDTLSAQKQDPKKWSGSAEASGTFLYGAANQRVASMTATLQRADNSALYKFEAQAGYGDSRKTGADRRGVVVRNMRLGTAIDLRRRDRISPYTFATASSSLQQRFTSRVDAGAGARMTIWKPDSVRNGFPEEATFSASVLGEQTRPISTSAVPRDDITRIRWSFRASYRKRLSPSLRISHVTLYQPSVIEASRLTLEVTTVVSAPLYARTELTVTHRERIDSEAVERGAPSRRDGQVLFGVRTTF